MCVFAEWANFNDLVNRWEKIWLFPFYHIALYRVLLLLLYHSSFRFSQNGKPFTSLILAVFFNRPRLIRSRIVCFSICIILPYKTETQFKSDVFFCCSFLGGGRTTVYCHSDFCLWQKRSWLQIYKQKKNEITWNEMKRAFIGLVTIWKHLRSDFLSLCLTSLFSLRLRFRCRCQCCHHLFTSLYKQQMYHIIFILHS